MSLEVERFIGELRQLRTERDLLLAERNALKARLEQCTCAATTAEPPTEVPSEEQLDLLRPPVCFNCD